VLSTPTGDEVSRSNAAVLLGAFMLLRHPSWSVRRVVRCLGEYEALAQFACPWQDWPEESCTLTVQDCWAGVQLARDHGWIQADFMQDDLKMEVACKRYSDQLERYDTTWIIPGKLMVGADPVTVMTDPNPATFNKLVPSDDHSESVSTADMLAGQPEAAQNPMEPSPSASCPSMDSGCRECQEHASDERQENASVRSGLSTDTVCKVYQEYATHHGEKGKDGRDFASFLVDSGIGLVVRANYHDEPGMAGSYSNHALKPYGIHQANIRIPDYGGSIPHPTDVARMLGTCDGFMETESCDAVMVHCKGGFGRSVVLAFCLAISRFDVPGIALMGWGRITRPGILTTPAQEAFINSFRGRRDVLRYAEMWPGDKSKDGVKVSCGFPCHVQ